MRLVPDRQLRTEHNGQILMGGHPFRLLRLSPDGAKKVRAWFAGAAPESEAERDLAARLVSAGLAHPVLDSVGAPTASLHVVVPFHGGQHEIEATVASLRGHRIASITIVDDGSSPAIRPIDGVTLLRNAQPEGPAAARNRGWRHVAATMPANGLADGLIAFVDGGVDLRPASTGDAAPFDRLVDHFADDAVAAVAPRVASAGDDTAIARYEQQFSPLDLGPEPSLVGPDRRVTYVPTAALLVRVGRLAEVGGFDEELRYGEDVDLIWRLGDVGQVRYDPSVVVHHRPRSSLRSFAAQRFHYATSAAALDERHPSGSAPWTATPFGIAGVALISLGHPVLGALAGAAMVPKLSDHFASTATPVATAVRLSSLAHTWSVRSFAENAGRSWVVAFAALLPLVGRRSAWWMAAGWLRRLLTTRSPSALALGVVDDVAYGAGTAMGAVRHRSARSLLPRLSGLR